MGFRRIISFITAAVISIGTLTAPVTVSAEETADTGQIVDETEVQGGNALSDMILDTAGDVSGAVVFLASEKGNTVTDLQKSLITAAAQFLARQIEG